MNFPYIVLGLITVVLLIIGFRTAQRRRVSGVTVAPMIASTPVRPRRVQTAQDNRLRNPYLLMLLPHVEAVVGLARRSLTVNEILPRLRREIGLPFTRRQVKACLQALTTNHHTVVRHETKRLSGRRGPYRYAAAA